MIAGINLTAVILTLFALVFGLLSLRDFLMHDHKLSTTSRIRLRIAIVFGAISLWLYWL